MNKTTDELLKILIFKGDMGQQNGTSTAHLNIMRRI